MLMRYAGAVVLVLCAGAPPVYGNDFPTRARVEFVLGCMKDSESPEQESMYKCSCAIDVLAGKMQYAAFVDLSTVANVGFVIGSRCVAVIDTGGTYAVGRALHDALRKVTALPVCYVVNTHAHPDHVFGNAAFVADRPEFVGHARLADALQRRAPNY